MLLFWTCLRNSVHSSDNIIVRNYKNVNYILVAISLFQVDWDTLFYQKNSNECTNIFYENIIKIIIDHVPTLVIYPSRYPKWFPKELKTLVQKKKTAHKTYKTAFSESDYEKFSDLGRKCKTESDICYKNFIVKVKVSIFPNVKNFWHFIDHKNKINGFPSLMFLRKISANNENDIAKLFSDNFEPLFVSGDVSNFDESNIGVLIHDDNPLVISEDKILTNIKELKSPNCIGPVSGQNVIKKM